MTFDPTRGQFVFQPVTGSVDGEDGDDVALMEQLVQECGGQNFIADELAQEASALAGFDGISHADVGPT